MRKTFRFLCITALTGCSLLGLSSCGDDYDDSEIRDRLEQVEDRVAKLEEWCTTANGEITALRGLIAALENKDYVTGVETLEDGYKITFSKSESIVIRNGKDGYTPVIGAAKHSNGLYYWTIQTEEGNTVWLTDAEGNMIRTTGDNGKDGADGVDGLTPHIGSNGNWWIGEEDTGIKAEGNAGSDGLTPKIGDNGNWWIGMKDTGVPAKGENGKGAPTPVVKTGQELGTSYIADAMYLSVDGGNNWIKISGDKGDTGIQGPPGPQGPQGPGGSIFESVTEKDDYLEVKLVNSELPIRLPYYSSALSFENYETTDVYARETQIKVILPDNLNTGNYKLLIATVAPVSGATSGVTTRASNGWTVSITQPDFNSPTATVTIAGSSLLDKGDQALLSVILTYKDGTQATVSKLVKFQHFGDKPLDEAATGDFYMSDGSLISMEDELTPIQKEECIGIVMKGSRDNKGNWADDCKYKRKNGETEMSTVHGYVLALYDVSTNNDQTVECEWGPYGTQVKYEIDGVDMMNRERYTGFYGYKNTQAVISFAKSEKMDLKQNFPAVYWVTNNTEGYESRFPAPANSSGWFLPSAGQCKYWIDDYNNDNVLLSSVKKVTENNDYVWKTHYWSSSEVYNSQAYSAWCADFPPEFSPGIVTNWNKGDYSCLRACLAF